jgi:hypothetical protein
MDHAVAQTLGGVHALAAGFAGLGGIEALADQGIGEHTHGALPIDFRLGTLGFEFVEDAGQFGDLTLVQVELVDQEAKWPADAQAATKISFVAWLAAAFPGSRSTAAARPTLEFTTLGERTPGVPPGPKGGMHRRFSFSLGLFAPGGDIFAWQHAMLCTSF